MCGRLENFVLSSGMYLSSVYCACLPLLLNVATRGIKDEPLNDSSGNPYLGFLLLSYDSGDPENPIVLGNGMLPRFRTTMRF